MGWKLQASENNAWGRERERQTDGLTEHSAAVPINPHFVEYIGGKQSLLKKSINELAYFKTLL